MYVDLGQSYTWPEAEDTPCHSGLSFPGFEYSRRKVFGVHRVLHAVVDFLAAGPDVAYPYVLALCALAQRFAHQVLEHGAGNGIGHHQRRRGEKVGFDVGVDARLEIAVAGKHRGTDQVVLDDRFLDAPDQAARSCRYRWCSRSRRGRSRASRDKAADPHLVRYSVTTREPGAREVLTCFLTVRPRSTAFFASRPAASSTPGLEVLVQEVMAAISTSPWPSVVRPVGGMHVGDHVRGGRLSIISTASAGASLARVVELVVPRLSSCRNRGTGSHSGGPARPPICCNRSRLPACRKGSKKRSSPCQSRCDPADAWVRPARAQLLDRFSSSTWL